MTSDQSDGGKGGKETFSQISPQINDTYKTTSTMHEAKAKYNIFSLKFLFSVHIPWPFTDLSQNIEFGLPVASD